MTIVLMIRKLGPLNTLCAWLLISLGKAILAAETPVQAPMVATLWSPVDGAFYLQDSDRLLVHVQIEATDTFQGLSPEAKVCVFLSRFVGTNASNGDIHGFVLESRAEDRRSSLQREAMPQIGNRPECVLYGNGGLDLPSYAVLDLHPGMYEVRYKLSDPIFGFEVSCASTFYLRAKHAFQRTILGASPYLDRNCARKESGSITFNAADQISLNFRKPVVVLALKYGTHGDDARASVCVDGKIVLDVPLAQLFRTETLEVQRELAREQGQRLDLRESHGGKWALKPRDEEALSSHLALQAATGFADGCEGVRWIRRLLDDIMPLVNYNHDLFS